jgi:hypothetical protein
MQQNGWSLRNRRLGNILWMRNNFDVKSIIQAACKKYYS